MGQYFGKRVLLLDESSREFLDRLVALGGYCTVSQAEGLKLAPSTRVRRRLRLLERIGFLRKVAAYPVVYQVTTSTARLLPRNSKSESGLMRLELAQVSSATFGAFAARTWTRLSFNRQTSVCYIQHRHPCALPKRRRRDEKSATTYSRFGPT